jgi:DNA-3-methyladenine glycosylase
LSRLAEVVARDVLHAAPALIGWTLLVEGVGGVIVEVEAYREDDPASHSFGGPRGRNTVMFGPPGVAYVYRSYGVHWCLNIVCEAEGRGAAVLVRALEPTHGLEAMRKRRRLTHAARDDRLLCAGPGRLTEALGVTDAHHGLPFDRPPIQLLPPEQPLSVASDVRIGISRAAERPWRFLAVDSPYVSRRPPAARRRP